MGVVIVMAQGPGGVIGAKGGLPWHVPEDLQHFRRLTWGHALVMGRKTWDSIGRPLPGRHSIVLTRTPGWTAPGAVGVPDFATALVRAREWGDDAPCVIGGASVFAEALHHAHRLHLTTIDGPYDGDVFLAPLDPACWEEVERVPGVTPGVTFCTFVPRASIRAADLRARAPR